MNVGSWKSGNMQLKFSKKSLSKESASCSGGSGMNALISNRSLKTSGFQKFHLTSFISAEAIISSNELSPVFSLTHCIPLGEKMEKPEEDPVICER